MTDIVFGSLILVTLILSLTALVVGARTVLMPERQIKLTINDQTPVITRTGQKLLSALHDNGVLVPSACAGAGTCGLCRVLIIGDGPDALPIEATHFTRAELRDGLHLACQVVMRGDIAVKVHDDLLGAESLTLQVVSARQLTPLIREIVLQLPDGVRPVIPAGSFVQLTAPPFALSFADIDIPPIFEADWRTLRDLHVTNTADTMRAYSLANRPEDTAAGRLVLDIRLALPPPSVADAPPGIVSSWLFSLHAGDAVQVSGPFGTFRTKDSNREMVFIGGGVGMAPLRAMIFEQLERLGSSRKITFWYGARTAADLFYTKDFDDLAARHTNFDWTVALSDPQAGQGWTGATGFVHQVALDRYLRDHPTPENCEYYLCGPPLMIRAVQSMLEELGVDSDSISNDDFGV